MPSAIYNAIVAQAEASGVPPEIALAVAQQESGMQQYTPSGNLVTGSAGDTGIFQIIPSTAAALGVDPTDPTQNIQGGVSLLAQLYQQYGNWTAALSAYNSGSPTRSLGYATSVLGIAQNQFGYSGDDASDDSGAIIDAGSLSDTANDLLQQVQVASTSWAGTATVGLILLGLGALWWAFGD